MSHTRLEVRHLRTGVLCGALENTRGGGEAVFAETKDNLITKKELESRPIRGVVTLQCLGVCIARGEKGHFHFVLPGVYKFDLLRSTVSAGLQQRQRTIEIILSHIIHSWQCRIRQVHRCNRKGSENVPRQRGHCSEMPPPQSAATAEAAERIFAVLDRDNDGFLDKQVHTSAIKSHTAPVVF